MSYKTLEDFQRAEQELGEVDRLLDQESDAEVKGAIQATAAAVAGGAVGVVGGGMALFFAGVVGFSGPGIMSGLAAIGALIGGSALAGLGVLAAAPVVLAGGSYGAVRFVRWRKVREARTKVRAHAVARRDFLQRLVNENGKLGEKLADYRFHLDRLNRMIEALDAAAG